MTILMNLVRVKLLYLLRISNHWSNNLRVWQLSCQLRSPLQQFTDFNVCSFPLLRRKELDIVYLLFCFWYFNISEDPGDDLDEFGKSIFFLTRLLNRSQVT